MTTDAQRGDFERPSGEPTAADFDDQAAVFCLAHGITDLHVRERLAGLLRSEVAAAREEGRQEGAREERAAVVRAVGVAEARPIFAEVDRLRSTLIRAAVAPAQPAEGEPRRPCICNRVAEGAAFHTPECDAQPVTRTTPTEESDRA